MATSNIIKLKENENYPSCDIFIATEQDGRLVVKGWAHSIQVKDLKPLQKYKFGEFFVWGNANPNPYQNDLYGKNWHDLANRGTDHINKNSHESSGMPFYLNKADYQPAQPTGLLTDKLDKIKKIAINIELYK